MILYKIKPICNVNKVCIEQNNTAQNLLLLLQLCLYCKTESECDGVCLNEHVQNKLIKLNETKLLKSVVSNVDTGDTSFQVGNKQDI